MTRSTYLSWNLMVLYLLLAWYPIVLCANTPLRICWDFQETHRYTS